MVYSITFFFFFIIFLSLSLSCRSSVSRRSHEHDSQFFVLPLTELTLEPPANLYTNLVLTNPLEHNVVDTTKANHSYDYQTTETTSSPPPPPSVPYTQAQSLQSIRSMQWYNSTVDIAHSANHHLPQPQPVPYTTSSLTTPITLKGTIPRLQRESTHSIPIPIRTQSHDDIRMIGSASSTPSGSPCISPNMYGSSPFGGGCGGGGSGLGAMNSPPTHHHTYHGGASPYLSATIARRAISRASSPLSSSVPSTANANTKPTSLSSRSQAVNSNYSRSGHKQSKIVFLECKLQLCHTYQQQQQIHKNF